MEYHLLDLFLNSHRTTLIPLDLTVQLTLHNVEGLLNLDLDVLLALNQRVMDKGIEEADYVLGILSQNAHDYFAVALEDALLLEEPKCLHYVLSKPKWNDLWDF